MGFGWLFLGYFAVTFLTLNTLGSLIRVLGYGLILIALFKLRKYQRAFDFAVIGTIVMLLISGVIAFSDVSKYLYDALIINVKLLPEGIINNLGYVERIANFGFMSALLWAIRVIAKDTGVGSISDNSIRNFIFICLYYAVYLITFLPFAVIDALGQELAMIVWILYFVTIILNLVLIGSCYARICDESDVEMAQKPSRLAFVNKFREEMDRRQTKAAEETKAYYQQKREKKKNRRNNGR